MEHQDTLGQPRVTTVAETAQKASIEPYNDAPVIEVPPGVIACPFCANTRFRRSRVRLQDLFEVLLLRFPLRCMRCNQRQFGSYLTAGLSLGSKTHGPRVAKGGETWQAWTEKNVDGPRLARPMSTALGPKATRLSREMPSARRTSPDLPRDTESPRKDNPSPIG